MRKSDIVARVNYGTLLVDVLEHNRIIFADITPIKNLTWHTELGYDLS